MELFTAGQLPLASCPCRESAARPHPMGFQAGISLQCVAPSRNFSPVTSCQAVARRTFSTRDQPARTSRRVHQQSGAFFPAGQRPSFARCQGACLPMPSSPLRAQKDPRCKALRRWRCLTRGPPQGVVTRLPSMPPLQGVHADQANQVTSVRALRMDVICKDHAPGRNRSSWMQANHTSGPSNIMAEAGTTLQGQSNLDHMQGTTLQGHRTSIRCGHQLQANRTLYQIQARTLRPIEPRSDAGHQLQVQSNICNPGQSRVQAQSNLVRCSAPHFRASLNIMQIQGTTLQGQSEPRQMHGTHTAGPVQHMQSRATTRQGQSNLDQMAWHTTRCRANQTESVRANHTAGPVPTHADAGHQRQG